MSSLIFWNDAHADQKISYRIEPQPGSMFPLTSIGAQMEALAKLLERNSPYRSKCLLAGIEMTEDGAITFNVIVAPKKGVRASHPHTVTRQGEKP